MADRSSNNAQVDVVRPSGRRATSARPPLLPAGLRRVLPVAGCLLAFIACRSDTELPTLGVHERTLVRLDGPPEPTSVPARLRVFVADAALGGSGTPQARLERVELLGARAATFSPDIAVIFDLPLRGDAFTSSHRPTGPVPVRAEVERVDVGEQLAVSTDLYHRLEIVDRRGRDPHGDGRLASGIMVAAEPSLSVEEGAGAIASEGRPTATGVSVAYASTERLSLVIADGPVDPGLFDVDLLVVRGNERCASDVHSGPVGLCVTPSPRWRVIRSSVDAPGTIAGMGTLVRVELERVPETDALAPADGSQ